VFEVVTHCCNATYGTTRTVAGYAVRCSQCSGVIHNIYTLTTPCHGTIPVSNHLQRLNTIYCDICNSVWSITDGKLLTMSPEWAAMEGLEVLDA
jgi:hypothetical protein